MRNDYKVTWLGGDGVGLQAPVLYSTTVRATAFSLARIMADKDFNEFSRVKIDDVQTIIITKVKNDPAT